MTREQAIKYLTDWKNAIVVRGDTLNSHAVQALNMAIKALGQEPSEDCIDRYAALAEVDPSSYDYKAIKELPSVEPKTKEGKWIAKDGIFYCSCCDNDAGVSEEDVYLYEFSLPNYCPNCGARMERQ